VRRLHHEHLHVSEEYATQGRSVAATRFLLVVGGCAGRNEHACVCCGMRTSVLMPPRRLHLHE
jgi:hypothetical protein